jgi:hypothetical protein
MISSEDSLVYHSSDDNSSQHQSNHASDHASDHTSDHYMCCYICLDNDDADDHWLHDPCPCTPAVHKKCFKIWLNHRNSATISASIPTKCEKCKQSYDINALNGLFPATNVFAERPEQPEQPEQPIEYINCNDHCSLKYQCIFLVIFCIIGIMILLLLGNMYSYQDAYDIGIRMDKYPIIINNFNSGQCALLNMTSDCFSDAYLQTECDEKLKVDQQCIDKCEIFCEQYIEYRQYLNNVKFIKHFGISDYEQMITDRYFNQKNQIFLLSFVHFLETIAICIIWIKCLYECEQAYIRCRVNDRPIYRSSPSNLTFHWYHTIALFTLLVVSIVIIQISGFIFHSIILNGNYVFRPTNITFISGLIIIPVIGILIALCCACVELSACLYRSNSIHL